MCDTGAPTGSEGCIELDAAVVVGASVGDRQLQTASLTSLSRFWNSKGFRFFLMSRLLLYRFHEEDAGSLGLDCMRAAEPLQVLHNVEARALEEYENLEDL